ncbi:MULTISPECIES: hypothetical protein [unclassified Amycolatopsis]|uniref:hypothetical protein n=1 Tax=unclassified Amycolatopsis TaxID=2618356 RepID=UPI001C695638|nr:hypothetical protein [Amycolatopsis sp. DSM 110486]QYN20403.1 hypothetical protein K1T34_49245 [Amycolatopsis sp. DSM 110486]
MTPTLSRRTRRIALLAHLVSSMSWLGLDLVLLALGVHAAADPAERHASYLVMVLLLDTLLVPVSLASIGSGLLLMRAGPWRFRRDRWATVKLVVSVVALPLAWFALRPRAAQAAAATAPGADPGPLFATLYAPGPTLVIAPAVACALYLAAAALGVYKPWRARASGRHAPGSFRSNAVDSRSG